MKNFQSITKRIAGIEEARKREQDTEFHHSLRSQGLNVDGLTAAQAVLLFNARYCLVETPDEDRTPKIDERVEYTKRRLGKRQGSIYQNLPTASRDGSD